MRKTIVLSLLFFAVMFGYGYAGLLDTIKEGTGLFSKSGPDESTVASGLKEALSIGTKNAVTSVSQVDGYFGNKMIRILMPGPLQTVADVLSKVGYKQQVDNFILSMNRAAEKAAPQAVSFFVYAIKEMTFEDAKVILAGGDTSATDFFKRKTSGRIYDAFKPIISSSMNEVGVTRSFNEMMDKYTALPFMQAQSLDLNHYVTKKAMDGLFYMVGQEEKKIRTNPAARVTDLLKKVFGK
jgi:RNA binding exosome subunit